MRADGTRAALLKLREVPKWNILSVQETHSTAGSMSEWSVFKCLCPSKCVGGAFLDALKETLECCNENISVFVGGDFNCKDRNHPEPLQASSSRMTHVAPTHQLLDLMYGGFFTAVISRTPEVIPKTTVYLNLAPIYDTN